ncbi:MAG: outer membrane lipoprotein carrier protein LolA [Elusimicrobia bacterium]|nr:outer membrane lipoprotein carrier protein LolA [Elusimicrobiota bacterium]
MMGHIVCLALALVAAPPSFAAAKKKAAAASGIAASTSTAVAAPSSLDVSTAPLRTVDELKAHFLQIDGALRGMTARFVQTVRISQAGLTYRVEGTVHYQKPDKLRMDMTSPERDATPPERQTVVADGKSVWVHRKTYNQVIETKLDAMRRSDPLIGNLLDLGNYSRLTERYDVSFDSGTLGVTLRPKGEVPRFTLRLWLKGTSRFPSETQLAIEAMQVQTVFEDIRFNPELDPALFTFVAPADAEVYRDFKIPAIGGEPQ